MRSMLLIGLFSAMTATACGSHTTMRGSVVMKIDETEAHVCLGKDEVKVGDSVHLFHNDCTGGKASQCRRVAIADGQVVQLLNEHYSLVRFPAGTAFAEGDTIERAP